MSHHEPTPEQVQYVDAEVQALIGKSVLAGVTYRTKEGVITARRQFHGVVCSASPEGIMMRLSTSPPDANPAWLPPAPRLFTPAAPGEYRLRFTGEVIVNPDFTTAWFVTDPPQPEASPGPPGIA